MQPADADAVRELMRQLCGGAMTRAEMLERLDFVTNSPVDWLFVCETDAGLVGALSFRLREQIERPGRYGEIYAVVVDAQARRQGIGRVMMDYAEAFARQHNCTGTWLVSGFRRADEAHIFYADLGYEITGYRFVKDLASPPKSPSPAELERET
jgi:GNAT superfamily N-acetyltransferase